MATRPAQSVATSYEQLYRLDENEIRVRALARGLVLCQGVSTGSVGGGGRVERTLIALVIQGLGLTSNQKSLEHASAAAAARMTLAGDFESE